jgi:YgiT-type zinc finger domain-containing protein
MRLAGRFIPREMILAAVASYELVEAYPDDKYLPSNLILARHGSEAFHVLFATDLEGDNVRVVTSYRPGPGGVAGRSQGEEAESMKCEVCGAELAAITTDLPFKVREPGIVILKGLPVLQCSSCPQYLLEDAVLARVDQILRRVDGGIELEVIRYAA